MSRTAVNQTTKMRSALANTNRERSVEGTARAACRNGLLSVLRSETNETPRVEKVELRTGDVLHDVGQPISDVFFPTSGAVCLATVLQTGEVVTNALIGPEGVVGYGRTQSIARSLVHLPGSALRMTVADLRAAASRVSAFRQAISHFNDLLVAQMQQSVACYAAHSLESRICRWLLCATDRMESSQLQLTQLNLALVLGAHRGSVNVAIASLQANGAVECRRRGYIILDRERAMQMSCECYARLRKLECSGTSDGSLPGEINE